MSTTWNNREVESKHPALYDPDAPEGAVQQFLRGILGALTGASDSGTTLSADGSVTTSASEADIEGYDDGTVVTLGDSTYLDVRGLSYVHVTASMQGTSGDVTVYTRVSDGDTDRSVREKTGLTINATTEIGKIDVQGDTYLRVTSTEDADAHVGGI